MIFTTVQGAGFRSRFAHRGVGLDAKSRSANIADRLSYLFVLNDAERLGQQGFYLVVDVLGGEAEFLVENLIRCREAE